MKPRARAPRPQAGFVWRQPQVPHRRLAGRGFCHSGCGRWGRVFAPGPKLGSWWCEDHAIAYALVKFAAWMRSL